MFPFALREEAEALLLVFRQRGRRLAIAESCTGGLIVALLTEVPGSSDVVERGFVTYSNDAKMEMLGVPPALLDAHDAVTEQVVRAMAKGALRHSRADNAVSVHRGGRSRRQQLGQTCRPRVRGRSKQARHRDLPRMPLWAARPQ